MYARGVGIVDPKSPWGQQNFNNSQLDKTCFIHNKIYNLALTLGLLTYHNLTIKNSLYPKCFWYSLNCTI